MSSLLSNPLATPLQLATSPSQSDGIPQDLEASLRLAGCSLIQSAGILLRLPQTTIATAIVLFQRFYLLSSMREHPIRPAVSAVLFLSAKLTEQIRKPRDIINVLAYIISVPTPCPISPPAPASSEGADTTTPAAATVIDPELYYVPESTYFAQRTLLLNLETQILKSISFQTHVSLPYTLAINYLQALDALAANPEIVKLTFGYLTDALSSPSLLYLTHQPNALATAAIYLAARECGAKMPDTSVVPGGGGEGGWWEVFDVEREELGFLVVCMKAVGEWVGGEVTKWKGGWGALLAVAEEDGSAEGVERELARRRREETM
ncbi:cyclin-like protein [Peziza echinospora]|nr:cyclin-like protein [Peziza echinospora]